MSMKRISAFLISMLFSIVLFAEDVIVMPEYPGGREAMAKFVESNLVYPEMARKMQQSGEVVVEFTVERGGALTGVNVIKGICSELDAEAVRVVRSMPRWKPGTKNGVPVRVTMTMPINFKIHHVKGYLDGSKETTYKKLTNRFLKNRKQVTTSELQEAQKESVAETTDSAAVNEADEVQEMTDSIVSAIENK